MAADPETAKFDATRRTLIALGVAGGLLTVAVFSTYGWWFWPSPIATESSEWGQFGDFVGGVLNPLMGFLAVIGLFWTIYQNQMELFLTRRELQNSSRALEQNNRLVALGALKDDLKRVIDTVHQALDLRMDVELKAPTASAGTSYVRSLSQLVDALPELWTNDEIWLTDNTGHVEDTGRLLGQLAKYLLEYEKFDEGRLVTDFYKRYHGRLAMLMDKAGAVDRDTLLDLTKVHQATLQRARDDEAVDFHVYFGDAQIADPIIAAYVAETEAAR